MGESKPSRANSTTAINDQRIRHEIVREWEPKCGQAPFAALMWHRAKIWTPKFDLMNAFEIIMKMHFYLHNRKRHVCALRSLKIGFCVIPITNNVEF